MEDESHFGVQAEYQALRDEILSRIKIRQQFIAGTLTLAAGFLGFALKFPIVALVYPPIAAFLILAWHQNNLRIRDIASYIREQIEPGFTTPGYESHMYALRRRSKEGGVNDWSLVLISHGGFFVFTELLAIVLGGLWLFEAGSSVPTVMRLTAWILASCDVLALFITLWLLVTPLPVGPKEE